MVRHLVHPSWAGKIPCGRLSKIIRLSLTGAIWITARIQHVYLAALGAAWAGKPVAERADRPGAAGAGLKGRAIMHSLFETYLVEVPRRTSARCRAKQRSEELREMRAHLENAVAGYQAQGKTEEAAAQAALAQFGPPQTVGAETVTAWRRGEMLNRRSFWGAAVCALAVRLFMPLLLALLETTYLLSH